MPETLHLLVHRHDFEDVSASGRGGDVVGGEPLFIDDDETDFKVIGLYTSRERAEAQLLRLRKAPGFRLAPEGFALHPYVVDAARWPSGFHRE